jgi:hypothetical protein
MARIAFIFLLAIAAGAAEFPSAEISNGPLRARLYLPDAERGYYRATRFEWSGVIQSLQYKGHGYFGVWFPRHDPKINDAITGPVEEFRTGEAGLGYAEARAGGTFIRIGAGVVRKPEEPSYRTFNTYDIVDPGRWRVRKGRDRIEFTHELSDNSGYAYAYRKVVRLVKNRPEMVIEHRLRNTGRKPIETSQYNHNFFVMDGQPSGPDFVVKFPFELTAAADFKGLAEARGKELVYLRELQEGQSVFSELKGYRPTARDYDIRIENRKTGAGVRIVGDQPLAKLVFWSIRTTLCPEPYIQMRVEPGRDWKWRINYEFYTLTGR